MTNRINFQVVLSSGSCFIIRSKVDVENLMKENRMSTDFCEDPFHVQHRAHVYNALNRKVNIGERIAKGLRIASYRSTDPDIVLRRYGMEKKSNS